MMIALPNPDRSFTCTLFWPNGGSGCFAALSSAAAIDRHFRREYPDFVPLAPTFIDDYQHNPVGLLGTVHAYPTMAEANKMAAGQWRKAHQPERLLGWVERYHAWRR